MSDLTFKEIWDTLYAVDVSDYTEEKMNLTYLSWARAWMLLMRHYPQAEYTFTYYGDLPYRSLPDGTAEVITKIQIEDHVRSMALPIMDYKNNSLVNPNSRQVSDNRMRCLVKNLAMFGLGMSVFASWADHLPDPKKDKPPKNKKLPPKKKEKTEEPKAEVTEETFDEAWANTVIEGVNATISMNKTKEELINFWKANKETIGRLKSDFPEQKKELDLVFKKYAESLNPNNEE
jgi:hypothetical protein